MSVNVQQIIKNLEARKNRNVQYLQKKAPQILEVAKRQSNLECGIYIDPSSGKIDLQIEGKRIYNGDPQKITMAQIEDFERYGFKFYFIPDINTQYKDIMMDMRHWDEFLNKAREMPNVDYIKKPIQKGDKLGILICLGIGLGYHLEIISKRYDIKHLIIVEQYPEILKASLYTIDWQSIIETYSKNNKTLFIFIKENPEELAKEVANYIQFALNTAICFILPVYKPMENPFYKDFLDEFNKRVSQIFSGWGFFQDEFWSLEQTLENIKKEIPLFMEFKKVSSEATAFIIGAGPSLENSFDFLKKNIDKAVVFSCGSSIGTLYREGLKPDFHVEIERTDTTYDALVLGADKEYLKSIPAIFNNPIYPEVSTLFNEKGMFLKENDAGAYLFPAKYPKLKYTNPTVVNGGLSLALHLGFKKIYLFGTDMGYKDPKKHHAKGNVSLDKNTIFFKEVEDNTMQIEGNFGGKVYTNFILNWARTWIEDALKIFPDVKVYNTSDGAKIKGTLPIREKEINLSNFNKAKEIEGIKSNFSKDFLKDLDIIKNRLSILEKEIKAFKDYTFTMLNSKMNKTEQFMDNLHNIYSWIHLSKVNDGMLHLLFRGGFLHLEHLLLFLCYQKELRGINLLPQAIETLKNYTLEAVSMILNCIEKFKTS